MMKILAAQLCLVVIAALPALPSARVTLRLADLAGEPQSTEQYSGRIVVLNFWATWCEPCRTEMPMLSDLQERYFDRGVIIVGASADDASTRYRIEPFLDDQDISIPVWVGATVTDTERFGLGTALPATAIIDQDGQIAFRMVGALRRKQVARRLNYLLSGKRGAEPARFLDTFPDPSGRHGDEADGQAEDGDHAHGGVGLEGASLVPS